MSVFSSGSTGSFAGLFAHPGRDLPAGLVVFLVATPLCLGIAQASGAPLLGGLIAGIVGGIVVGAFSGSSLSVSGPAAGLAVIVAAGIQELGFQAFLIAGFLAGALQLVLGMARLGVVAQYFPTAVIKGMLAAIGVLIVLKQLPHAVGYDADLEGDEAFVQADGHNTFSMIADSLTHITPGAVVVMLLCAACYVAWPRLQRGALKFVPTPLVAVVVGGVAATLLSSVWSGARLSAEHLVALPLFSSFADVAAAVVVPAFDAIGNPAVWRVAMTLAIVASIETLLSLEAVDRLDPDRRLSPPNRELMAQGIGNMVSASLGGLPVTSVIVRSSANVQAGGKTRLSALTHGVLLALGVLFAAPLLNRVPLAALAVVLIVVGMKLTSLSLWRSMWRAGWSQFIPFAVTVAAIVFTDLLKGTLIGVVVGLVFAVRRQQQNAVVVATDVTGDRPTTFIRFTKDMTFLQKARVKDVLRQVPDHSVVIIDRERVDFVDDDVEELLAEFAAAAPARGIVVDENLPPAAIARRATLSPGH